MRWRLPALTAGTFEAPPGGFAFAAAAALVAGEAVAFAAPRFASVWPWAAFILALMVLAAYGWNLRRGGFLFVFVLGAVLAARCDARLAAALAPQGPGPARARNFELVVGPDVSLRAAGVSKPAGTRYADFTSRAGGIDIRTVVLVMPGAEPPRPGETWRCSGWLGEVRKGRPRFAPRKFWATAPGAAARVAAADPDSVGERFRRLSDNLSRRAGLGLASKPETADLNRAILLGRRADLPRDRRQTFVDAGTVHVFAISGLHVMLVAALLAGAAALFGLPFERRGLVVIPLVVGYTVLTGARPSAIRAAMMAAFYFAAPLVGRRPDALASWSLTALIVYGLDPTRFFDVGCALSFVVMLGIVVWCRWSRRFPSPFEWLDRRIRVARASEEPVRRVPGRFARCWTAGWRMVALPVPPRFAAAARGLGRRLYLFIPEKLIDRVDDLRRHPHPARLAILRAFLAAVLGSAAVSLAAWTAGTPVAAHVFGRFTPCGLLANLVVIPAATVVVSCGMLGLAASYVCDPLAAALNYVAGLGTDLMTATSEAVTHIPGGHCDVEPWTILECAAWYGAVALLMFAADRLLVRRASDLSWMK